MQFFPYNFSRPIEIAGADFVCFTFGEDATVLLLAMNMLESHARVRFTRDRQNFIRPLFGPRFRISLCPPVFRLCRDEIGNPFFFVRFCAFIAPYSW